MTSSLKSKLLNDFKKELGIIKNHFVKKCKNQINFNTEDRNDFETLINDESQYQDFKKYDYLLASHFFAFYEMRDYILTISFNFPHSFTDYEDLKNNTSISMNFDSKYSSKENKITMLSYDNLVERNKTFLYFSKIFNEYEIFERTQESPNSLRSELFSQFFFASELNLNTFSERFKNHEDKLLEALSFKLAFIKRRAEINRAKKDAKKKNKSKNNKAVKDNESEIRMLKRKIRTLEKENESLKRGEINYTQEEVQEYKELEKRYEDVMKGIVTREHRIASKNNFENVYEVLFN